MAFDWFNRKPYREPGYASDQRYYNKLENQMSESNEPYRVGVTTDGKVTLTLIANGMSTTMTMAPEACEAMIRILRATYTTEKETEK